jgi:hypothetical protein
MRFPLLQDIETVPVRMDGMQDNEVPVARFKPLDAREVARWQARLYVASRNVLDEPAPREPVALQEGEEPPVPAGDAPNPGVKEGWVMSNEQMVELAAAEADVYLALFDERVAGIDNLEIGPEGSTEPYSHDNPAHRRSVPLDFQTLTALLILRRGQLGDAEMGKSSLPSGEPSMKEARTGGARRAAARSGVDSSAQVEGPK